MKINRMLNDVQTRAKMKRTEKIASALMENNDDELFDNLKLNEMLISDVDNISLHSQMNRTNDEKMGFRRQTSDLQKNEWMTHAL